MCVRADTAASRSLIQAGVVMRRARVGGHEHSGLFAHRHKCIHAQAWQRSCTHPSIHPSIHLSVPSKGVQSVVQASSCSTRTYSINVSNVAPTMYVSEASRIAKDVLMIAGLESSIAAHHYCAMSTTIHAGTYALSNWNPHRTAQTTHTRQPTTRQQQASRANHSTSQLTD